MKPKRFEKTGILIFLLSLLVCLAACQSRINKENFDKVQRGMTEQEVIDILGEPTNTAGVEIGPFSGTSATWKGEEATITVQFLSGKVRAKGFTGGRN